MKREGKHVNQKEKETVKESRTCGDSKISLRDPIGGKLRPLIGEVP